MRLRHLFLCLLTILFVASVAAQTTAAGSDIVSRTLLSSDGTRAVEQRVYDNGLGDAVQEIQSYTGSSLPSVIVHQRIRGLSPDPEKALLNCQQAKTVFWNTLKMETSCLKFGLKNKHLV